MSIQLEPKWVLLCLCSAGWLVGGRPPDELLVGVLVAGAAAGAAASAAGCWVGGCGKKWFAV
jgi:hypothetical protein